MSQGRRGQSNGLAVGQSSMRGTLKFSTRERQRGREIRTEVGCTSVSNLTKNKRKDRDNQDFKTKTKPRMRE